MITFGVCCQGRVAVRAEVGAVAARARRPDGVTLRPHGPEPSAAVDTERIGADYSAGVLTLTIPVREAAKPRRVSITSTDSHKEIAAAS